MVNTLENRTDGLGDQANKIGHPLDVSKTAIEGGLIALEVNGTDPNVVSLYQFLSAAFYADASYFERYIVIPKVRPINHIFIEHGDGDYGRADSSSFSIKINRRDGKIKLDPPDHSFDNCVIGGRRTIIVDPGTIDAKGRVYEDKYRDPSTTELTGDEINRLIQCASLMTQMYADFTPDDFQLREKFNQDLFTLRYQGTNRRGMGGIGLEPRPGKFIDAFGHLIDEQ